LDEFLNLHPFDAVEFYRTKSDSLYEAFKKATLTDKFPFLVQKKKRKKKKKKKKSSILPDQDSDQDSGKDPFFGFCPVHQCNFSLSEKRSYDLSELFCLKRFLPDPIIKIVTGYADFYRLDLSPVCMKSFVSSKIVGPRTDLNSIKTRNLNRFLGTLVNVLFYEKHIDYGNRNMVRKAPLQLQSLMNLKTGEISPQAFADYFVGRLGHNKCMSINFGSNFITCSEERFCSCNVCSLEDLQTLFSDVFGRKALVYEEKSSLKLPFAAESDLDPLDRNPFYQGYINIRINVDRLPGPFIFKVPILFESLVYWLDLGTKICFKHPNVQSILILAIGEGYLFFEYDDGYTGEQNVPSTIYYSPTDFLGEQNLT
jgi:hypothetical protein